MHIPKNHQIELFCKSQRHIPPHIRTTSEPRVPPASQNVSTRPTQVAALYSFTVYAQYRSEMPGRCPNIAYKVKICAQIDLHTNSLIFLYGSYISVFWSSCETKDIFGATAAIKE